MPGNLLFSESTLPHITGDTKKDIQQLYDYIHILQEEIRYTMSNLGIENFNAAGLADITSSIMGGSLSTASDVTLFSADPSEMEIGDVSYALEMTSTGIMGYIRERQTTGTITTTGSIVLLSKEEPV